MSMNEDTRASSNAPGRESAERDKMEGTRQDLKGRVKESAGALTGDQRLKAQGQGDQLAGTARRKKGNLKDRIKGWIDRR